MVRAEQVLAQLLETSAGDGGVEVDTLVERSQSRSRSERTTRGYAWHARKRCADGAEHGRLVDRSFLFFLLKLGNEVVDETVVEVLTTQVSVTGGGLVMLAGVE